MSVSDWFAVDKDGLAQLLDRRGRYRVTAEPIANAFDEDGVTTVKIELAASDKRGVVQFSIEDDSPTGWRQLSDAYSLFAPSYKKGDPTKRGRFNSGDKQFLSVCEWAQIATTTGTIVFDSQGRHEHPRTKRTRGSVFEARLRFTKPDLGKALALIRTLIIPDAITVTLNGAELEHRKPVHTFDATLPTEFQDDQGQWHDTARKTIVRLFEAVGDEKPTIYELGIPVVEERDSRWHVDVGQKVPLTSERDNIAPSYVRRLREQVLNNSHHLLNDEDANSVWVRDAIPKATPQALSTVLDKRFGTNRVVADPSDPEANKLATAAGATVIAPRSFSKEEWNNIKQHDLVKPAGQVYPSNSAVNVERSGEKPKPFDDWSPGMRKVAAFATLAAKTVLRRDISVSFYTMPLGSSWAAAYGNDGLCFNVTRLGYKWFDSPSDSAVIELLIHEFAHQFSTDHLSHDFNDAVARVGAGFWKHAEDLQFEARIDPSILAMLRDAAPVPIPDAVQKQSA